jgi:hypothetical protein
MRQKENQLIDLSRTPHDVDEEMWLRRKSTFENVLAGLEVRELHLIRPEVQVQRNAILRDLQERWHNGDIIGLKRKAKPGMSAHKVLVYGFVLLQLSLTIAIPITLLVDTELATYVFLAWLLPPVIALLYSFGVWSPTPMPQEPPMKPYHGFDWISHVSSFTDNLPSNSSISRHAEENLSLIDWVSKRELGNIRRTYGLFGRDSEQYNAEVNTLTLMIERERKHFARDNYQQIPMDPEKQTEIQKFIVNADLNDFPNFFHTSIKDPDTGMYWDFLDGFPCLSPTFKKYKIEKQRWESNKALVWDEKRSATRNAFRFFGSLVRED